MYRTGQLPDIDQTMEWARDSERESLKINKKESIAPDYLIRTTVSGVLSRCKESYDVSAIEKSNIKRELSLAVRRVKQGFKALKTKELLKEGETKKEVARLLNVNINTVRTYSNTSINEIRDNFLDFLDFCKRNNIKRYADIHTPITDALATL